MRWVRLLCPMEAPHAATAAQCWPFESQAGGCEHCTAADVLLSLELHKGRVGLPYMLLYIALVSLLHGKQPWCPVLWIVELSCDCHSCGC